MLPRHLWEFLPIADMEKCSGRRNKNSWQVYLDKREATTRDIVAFVTVGRYDNIVTGTIVQSTLI